jgi:hypothetical protein
VDAKSDHRGAAESTAKFAPRFIEGRLVGFEKDMTICLTSFDSPVSGKKTHAYFPALAACLATLEYFVALHRGNLKPAGWVQIAAFASRYLPQQDFDKETVRILFQAFRHPVAHRGITTGIWVDQTPGIGKGRRLAWMISAGTKRPACQVIAEIGILKKDPPWPTAYTHRVHIHLGALWRDICDGARLYAKEIAVDPKLQVRFDTCMQHLYPR